MVKSTLALITSANNNFAINKCVSNVTRDISQNMKVSLKMNYTLAREIN